VPPLPPFSSCPLPRVLKRGEKEEKRREEREGRGGRKEGIEEGEGR
jgi:hypothetical protein